MRLAFIAIFLLLLAIDLAPFIYLGKEWGAAWVILTLPTSALAMQFVDLSVDRPFLIFAVGVIHSLMLSSMLLIFFASLRYLLGYIALVWQRGFH